MPSQAMMDRAEAIFTTLYGDDVATDKACIEAIAAFGEAIEREAGGEWQEMDTAPRDGTAFLGWLHYGYAVTAYFQDGTWRTPVREGGYQCIPTPTDWRPLPDRPSRNLTTEGADSQ